MATTYRAFVNGDGTLPPGYATVLNPNTGTAQSALSDGSDSTVISAQAGAASQDKGRYIASAGLVLPATLGPIVSCQVRWRGRVDATAGAQARGGYYIGGTAYYRSPTTSLPTSLADRDGPVDTTNPATGLPWTIADVRNLGWIAGVRSSATGQSLVVAAFSIDVIFNPPSGGVVMLLE